MHPNAVIPLHLDRHVIKEDVLTKSILYVVVVFLNTIIISALGVDNLSVFSGTVAAIGNVGPGLGIVGSTGEMIIMSANRSHALKAVKKY